MWYRRTPGPFEKYCSRISSLVRQRSNRYSIGFSGWLKAAYAAQRLTEVPGVEPLFGDALFFKEFPVRLPRPAAEVRDAMLERGYLAGVPLPDADGHALLVAVTERRSREQIDGLAMADRKSVV